MSAFWRGGSAVALALALALALGACASVNPANYSDIAAGVTVERDPYRGETAYRAPDVRWNVDLTNSGAYFLRAFRTDAGAEVVQLYVQADMLGRQWLGLDAAQALGGERIRVTRIATDVSCGLNIGCIYSESVGLNLTRDQLKRFAESGLDVQVSGRAGRVTFQVPAAYFRAFGDAIAL